MRTAKAGTPASPFPLAARLHPIRKELETQPHVQRGDLHRAHLVSDGADHFEVRRDPSAVVHVALPLIHRAEALQRLARAVCRRSAELLCRARGLNNMRAARHALHRTEGPKNASAAARRYPEFRAAVMRLMADTDDVRAGEGAHRD